MIRSTRIPAVLDRICDGPIKSAMLVTSDGELLGSSTNARDPENFATLATSITMDYRSLGEEYAGLYESKTNNLHCLLFEMDGGMVCILPCGNAAIDCLVMAVADPNIPVGFFKARVRALASYIQNSLSTLTST